MKGRERPPAVAGAFYPEDPDRLRRAVLDSFEDARGVGHPPNSGRRGPRRIRAAVVPHAGFVYSGPIAARAYDAVGSEDPPKELLLLGVDHHGAGEPFALATRPWRTPLGTVPVALELTERLHSGPIRRDDVAHAEEHSIEVQLPFLQTVLPGVPLAALSVRFGPLAVLREVGARVAAAVKDRDVLLIASTDFSHYVPPETARRLDALALAQIERRDGEGLYRTVVEHEISMCGIAPTTVLLEALKAERLTVRNLGWSHSGVVEPMARVVGYAAALLESR